MASVTVATCTDLTNMLKAPGALDCSGAKIDLTTASLATCADVPAVVPPTAPTVPGGPKGPATITDPDTGTVIEIPQEVIDCNGAVIDLTNPATALVTCTTAPAAVCTALAALPAGGPALAATKLVGADCKTYTIPATPVDLNVTNFAVVGGNLELTDADGSVFQIPLSSLVRLNGCDGNPINMATAEIATCDDVPVVTPSVPPAVPGQPVGPATITDPANGHGSQDPAEPDRLQRGCD